MKQIIECVKSHRFWNFIFKILLILLLVGIFFSLSNISHSLKSIIHPEKNGKYMDVKKEKIASEKKDEKKEEKKIEVSATEDKKTASGEEVKTEDTDSGWSFWGKDEKKDEKKTTTSSGITQDPEQRYNFRCDGGNLLRVYEGKYEIRGQKSTLEAGKIALDDPQSGRIHFLTKTNETAGKASYEKVVTRLENGKESSYTYVLTTSSNGEATFTKNGAQTYKNCKILK